MNHMILPRLSVLREANAFAGTSLANNPEHVAVHSLGLDLVGSMKKSLGDYTHLLVTVDEFTKWIEARPIATIGIEEAVKFFLDIIHRFGVPNSIITDKTRSLLGDDYNIQVDWVALIHPQSNGQVERANGMVLRGPSLGYLAV